MAKHDLIPPLPDNISIHCIALVPRSYHPFLSAVSRNWRALIRSNHLFSVRIKIGAAQPFLLINLCTPTNQFHWYIIDRHRHNHSSALTPLPPPPFDYNSGCSPIALGYSLYLIGGCIGGIPSTVVQIYDFRFNSWRIGVPMLAPRQFCVVEVICGRIYVVGGCFPCNDCWAEEFDPEKQRWRKISSLPELLEKSWSLLPESPNLAWRGRAIVVRDILFACNSVGEIRGFDYRKNEWMTVEGVEKQLPKHFREIAIGHLGELLCLFYKKRRNGKKLEVVCVGIRVTRTSRGGLDGSVEWFKTLVLEFSKVIWSSHCFSLEF